MDLETGALVAVTLQDADQGDTTTIIETVIAAAEQSEDAQAAVQAPEPLAEIIADKGYHSNQIMLELAAVGLRTYVAEPDRGRRDWSKEPAAPSRCCTHVKTARWLSRSMTRRVREIVV